MHGDVCHHGADTKLGQHFPARSRASDFVKLAGVLEQSSTSIVPSPLYGHKTDSDIPASFRPWSASLRNP
jgi:hypothetical protein